jgi:hypothetical protein
MGSIYMYKRTVSVSSVMLLDTESEKVCVYV